MIHMPLSQTDDNLRIMGCYYESPIFYADPSREAIEIADEAFERFCSDDPHFRYTSSVELVPVD